MWILQAQRRLLFPRTLCLKEDIGDRFTYQITSTDDHDLSAIHFDSGTHQQLLAQRGIYYKLYQLQYKDQEAVTAVSDRGRL